jgi:chemotaxis protein methyltransferase CheR
LDEITLEKLEIELVLEVIFQRYGYDFRSYARASMSRRVRRFLLLSDCDHISELIPRLLHDERFFEDLVQSFSITVTEMFRDPSVYRSIRERIVPVLKTWPYLKVWHAGCATGEEVYSLAILLTEEGLYDRCTIFATDFNDAALETARNGIYPMDRAQQATRNHQAAGGRRSFSEYYQARYESMAVAESLKTNITFANHNLVTDDVFGEMHLVLCRNVLIYFDPELKSHALDVFSRSLVPGGFLCLGDKESLGPTEVGTRFIDLDPDARLFKKRQGT